MALREIQNPVPNAPDGALAKGKVSVTALQRQALGNMANNKKAKKLLETKKLRDDTKALPTSRKVTVLAKRTTNAAKAETKPSQLTKAQKAKPTQIISASSEQPAADEIADSSKPEQQLVERDVRVRKRTRTMTPQQSLDIREIAGKIEHGLKLFDTDMDEADAHDPNACAIYVKEIFEYLYQLEHELHPDPDYMSRQPKINPRMRAILIDWLVLVHTKFSLVQETLFLTIAIIDRFLEVFIASKEQLQLVGVTAMYLASKYEEIYFPLIGDFVYMTDNSYTTEQIRQMERIMLRSLDYNLGSPAPTEFLRRYSKLSQTTVQAHTMAKYFIELCLLEYSLLCYLPSQIAAASLYISMKLLDAGKWCAVLTQQSSYSVTDLQPVMCDIAKTILHVPLQRQQAIREKYSTQKRHKIAKHIALASSILKVIADSSE